MNKTGKILFGIIVSVGCIYVAFKGFDFSELGRMAGRLDARWLILWAFIYFLAHGVRALRWRWLLSPMRDVAAIRLLPILLFGFFVNNVLPARAGEVARSIAAARHSGLDTGACIGSVAAERVFDMLGVVFIALIAAAAFPLAEFPLMLLILSSVAAVVGGGVLLAVYKHFHSRIESAPPAVRRVVEFIGRILAGFTALRSPYLIGKVLMATLVVWCLECLNIVVFSRAFDMGLGYAQSAALQVGMCTGALIPAAPGFVGTIEMFGKRVLIALGFSPDASLAFVVMLHAAQIVITTMAGIPALFMVGLREGKSSSEKVS